MLDGSAHACVVQEGKNEAIFLPQMKPYSFSRTCIYEIMMYAMSCRRCHFSDLLLLFIGSFLIILHAS